MPTVYAYSIDFDGCIMGNSSCEPKIQNLMRYILGNLEADLNSQVVLMVGSYRQSIGADVYSESVKKNGSCFPVYLTLVGMLRERCPHYASRISFDPLLLADIHENKTLGAHFDSAIMLRKKSLDPYRLADRTLEMRWHDKTKCALQYVQMHHLASRFPTHTVYYYLHDNCDEEILVPSHEYFNRFRCHIPKNVTHHHHHYVMGEYGRLFSVIKGEGQIDSCYRDTVCQFDGKLTNPISPAFSIKPSIAFTLDNQMDDLRREFLLHPHRFLFFKRLIQKKGLDFLIRFVDTVPGVQLQNDYHGFLLHQAISDNNFSEVKKLLSMGANFLLLNEQGIDALALLVQTGMRQIISQFLEYAEVQFINKELMRYVLALSSEDFYRWVNTLISENLHRSASVVLQHRLGGLSPDYADFAKWYIEKRCKKAAGELHCTKIIFWELSKILQRIESSPSSVSQCLRLFRSHIVSMVGDNIENPALEALCYFISEFNESSRESVGVNRFHLHEMVFEILKMTTEVANKIWLLDESVDDRIRIYYGWIKQYYAVILGLAKEEVNNLNEVAKLIFKRFEREEVSLQYIIDFLKAKYKDVPWVGVRTVSAQAPHLLVLKSIREQSNKNAKNQLIQDLYISLQSLILQASSLPAAIPLIRGWMNKQVSECTGLTVSRFFEEVDDKGCTCFSFFSPKNMGFLKQLPAQIEALTQSS